MKKKTNNNNNDLNLSYHSEEPPPDPNDYTTLEEEQRNRQLLEHLKEQQTKHREFVKQMELEKKIREEILEEQRQKELIANKAYLDRRNAAAKFRAKENNERISRLLAKVDTYMKKIEKIDSIEEIKRQAEKEYQNEINKNKKLKKNLTKEEIDK
jgi:hypothetical protein